MNPNQQQPINLQEPTQPTPGVPNIPTSPTSDATQNQQLDPTIVNMARAIKSVETSGSSSSYTATGKSGEYGAYQFMPQTWSKLSQQYLGQDIPVQQASISQQNQVAYNYIKSLKDQGYNPAQVASIWNSGKPDPTGNVGTNKYGAAYNTPQYVQSVVSAYNNFKSGLNFPPQPTDSTVGTPTQQNNTSTSILPNVGQIGSNLGQQLQGKAKDISQNIGDIAAQLSGQKGSQGWWSDLLQTGGDIAGGIGDVINAGLQLVPGVQAGENWVGGEIGKAADTQVGQQVVKAIKGFQQSNPELSKDIGAGFNIATAIPILKGLGAVKDVAMSGLGNALKDFGTNAIQKTFTDVAPSVSKAGKAFFNNNPEVLGNLAKDITSGDLSLPSVDSSGKMVMSDLKDDAFNTIADTNKQVDPILNSPKYAAVGENGDQIAQRAINGYTDRFGNVNTGLPNSGLSSQEVIDVAKKLDPLNKTLWDKFEAGQANIKEINQLRSSLDGKVKKAFLAGATLDTPEISAQKEIGVSLSNAMRDYVQQVAPETQPLFQKMSRLYDNIRAADYLDGKKIPISFKRKVANFAVKGALGALIGSPGGTIGRIGGAVGGEMFPGGILGSPGVGGILGKIAAYGAPKDALKLALKKAATRIPAGLVATGIQQQNQ